MKTSMISLGLLMLTGSFVVAQHPPESNETCRFTILAAQTQPSIAGPDDIVPLVHVVEQPDSPVEIVAVDLEGTRLSVGDGQYSWSPRCSFKIRNRSDRIVQRSDVLLEVYAGGGASGEGSVSSAPFAPGQTVELKGCGGNGHGGAPNNHVRLLVSVKSVDLGDCFYQPSMRIPRSLGPSKADIRREKSDAPLGAAQQMGP